MSERRCEGPGGRGCSCAYHVTRRRYNREHARKRRAAKLTEANRTAGVCQHRQGVGRCGTVLETRIVEFGRTEAFCPACERRLRGICRDCPAPVAGQIGKAVRCARHQRDAKRGYVRRYTARHHDEVLAKARKAYRNDDAVRERRNEYKRQWRKANRDKVRAQKQRYIERHRNDPNSAYNRYHAEYRQRYAGFRRETERQRAAVKWVVQEPPRCTHCGKKTGWSPLPGMGGPWLKCNRCAWPHEVQKRKAARRRALARIKADPELSLPPEQRPIARPRAAAERGPELERTCLTPGCDRVVTRRKKKCSVCRQRDTEAARAQLALVQGRGRRTDLARPTASPAPSYAHG